MTPPQPDKDLETIRDFIVMASDWEIQQEMALDALHRLRPAPSPQENDDDDYDYYRCTSDTCEDSGGCCHLKIPKDGQEPSSCTTPEAFTDNGDEPECIWEKYMPEPKAHDTSIRNATLDEFYKRIKAERDPSLGYVDWDSIEAVFIHIR